MTEPVLSEFESMVSQLMALTRVSREKAEATIRANRPELAPVIAVDTERDDRILESREQQEVRRRLMTYGFRVLNLSQARKSKQAPGIPDLWCVHKRLPIAFWWETKRQVGGELSFDQEVFRDECLRCDVGWGSGDRHAILEHLVTLEVLERKGDEYHPGRRLRELDGP